MLLALPHGGARVINLGNIVVGKDCILLALSHGGARVESCGDIAKIGNS